MKSPFCAYKNWGPRRLERARAKGALHVFWFYLSMGLVWGLCMVAVFTALDYHHGRALDSEDFQTRALIYFAGGLLFGLVMWVVGEAPGTARRDIRR